MAGFYPKYWEHTAAMNSNYIKSWTEYIEFLTAWRTTFRAAGFRQIVHALVSQVQNSQPPTATSTHKRFLPTDRFTFLQLVKHAKNIPIDVNGHGMCEKCIAFRHIHLWNNVNSQCLRVWSQNQCNVPLVDDNGRKE